MATRYAVTSGLWSDPATWNGGTLPGPGDSVHPNTGNTVTIDQDIDVWRLSTFSAGSPPYSGGGFQVLSIPPEGRVLACDIEGMGPVLTVLTSGVISGFRTIRGGTTANGVGLAVSAPNVTIHADVVVGGMGYATHAISSNQTGLTIIANSILGGTADNSVKPHGVSASGNGVTIVADVVAGGAGGYAMLLSGTGLSVTCNSVTAGVGGGGISASGSVVAIDILGTCEASTSFAAVEVSASPYLRVRGPLIAAPNGRLPIFAPYFTIPDTDAPFSMEVRDDLGQPVTLTNIVAASPPPADVRAGVVYGIDNTLTGTLPIPDAGAVAYGTLVDDTTGTAALDLHDVAEALGQRIATTIGG